MVDVLQTKKLLYQVSSDYGTYRVIDMMYNGRPSRLLFGDDKSPQSGIALDQDLEMLFDYNQRFMEITASLRPSRVLVIGGGAFSFPTALVERSQDVIVDVVEIDPVLPKIARKFFYLKKHPNLNIVIGDGRQFIEQSQASYDLIVVDAFSGMDIPQRLLSVEAAKAYKKVLAPSGVIALNFISAYHTPKPQLAHQLLATFGVEFASVELYPAEYASRVRIADNLVMVASDNPMPNLDYLQSASLSPLVGMTAQVIHDH